MKERMEKTAGENFTGVLITELEAHVGTRAKNGVSLASLSRERQMQSVSVGKTAY